jgi:hypothetical protein
MTPSRFRRLPAALLLGVLALARPASAGWTIDFTIQNHSSASYSYRGRALVEGDSVRYDVLQGTHVLFNPQYSVISRQGGKTLIILDHRMKTYFMRDARQMMGPISTWRAPGQQDTSSVSTHVSKDETAKGDVGGHPASKYDLKASYTIAMKVEGEKMKARVKSDADVWVMDDRSDSMPFGLSFALKSGIPEIDAELEKRLGKKGLPLRGKLTVTRTIGDGDAITESMTFDADRIEEAKHPESLFTAPPNYSWKEPTFGYEQ